MSEFRVGDKIRHEHGTSIWRVVQTAVLVGERYQ